MSEATDFIEMDFQPAGPSKGFATPWARFWAKMFDLWLATSIILALWYAIVYWAARTPALAPVIESLFSSDQNSTAAAKPNYLWNLVGLAIAMVADATIQATFGSTLGLKIVGARLERLDHTRLSYSECIKRNFDILIYGFWFGFLAFIPMIINYRRLNKGEMVTWDRMRETRVYSYHGTALRTTLAALCLLLLASAHIALVASISK